MNSNSKSIDSQKSLVEAVEKYKKLFNNPEVVKVFKELGYDVQKDLTVIEEESKKIISATKREKIGFFTNIIAHILKFLYAGKANALYNQINNNPKLLEANRKLEQSVDDYKKLLNEPRIKKYLSTLDPKIAKGIIDLSDPF